MKHFSTSLRCVLAGWLASVACVSSLHAQSLVANLTPPSERGMASFEVWANQRSNALSSDFLYTFQTGGFLSRAFFDEALAAHPLVGGMGVQAGWAKRGSTRPLGDGPWAVTGSLGSEVLVSTLWRRDLFELAFLGNAGHTGRVDVFSGTGMRVGAFNRLSLGMEHVETRQRLELSVVQRVAGVEWGIPNGSFWVSEGVDSMEVNMQAYGLASLDRFPDTSGVQFNHVLPAYGVGVSGSLPLTSDLFPLQFLVDFQDVGVMWEPAGGLVAAVDTGFVTSGLRVPFSSYFTEGSSDNEDGITWQDIVDGTTGIDPDSLYFVSDSALGRMLMLPTKIHAQLSWWPTPDLQVRAQARAGSWMPEPQFTVGVGWIPTKRLAFGLDYRTGGWGGARPVTWFELRVTKKRILSIEVDDPLGWMWGSEQAVNTYGRGVRVSLKRLPGAGWTRFMGLPSRDLRSPAPVKQTQLPQTSSRP
ncbi:MAG: hypothetical protein ACPG66_01980 [Flavobacteriales bacterium]